MDTGPVRKSARHARQRFREESSSESSESEHSSSNSSSSDDELPARPPDPTDPLFVQPRYELPVGKRGRLARPMHKGDDEGRDPAKRVRRPPPEDDEEGESTAARATDYLEDDDEDDEDSSDSGSRRAPAMAARRRSQRVVRQAPAAVGQQGSHTAADQPDSAGPARARAAAAAAGPARVRLSKCWLCTFANCKMAKRIAEFVSANAGSMDPAIMADQIKGEVKKEVSISVCTCLAAFLARGQEEGDVKKEVSISVCTCLAALLARGQEEGESRRK